VSSTKITRKGQITIPKEVREKLALEVSDKLEVKVVGNFIVMERFEPFESLKGSLKIPDKYKENSWKEIEAIAQKEHAKEVMDE